MASPSPTSIFVPKTFNSFLVVYLAIFVAFAAGEISLQQIPLWTEIDACAQSCALSASSYFSRSLQCPGTDPASCLCTLGPTTRLAGLAHVCASQSCTAFPSYSADPERARAALTTYCEVNAVQSSDAAMSSNPVSISTSETYPTITSTSVTATPISPTTLQITTPPGTSFKVVPTYSSSASLTGLNTTLTSSIAPNPLPSQSGSSSDSGLSKSDQIAIGVGVPSAVFALIGLYLIWKQPFAGRGKGRARTAFNLRMSFRRSLRP